MSVLQTLTDITLGNLVVIFSSNNISSQLLLAAIDWTVTKHRKTHYLRRDRLSKTPAAVIASIADPARFKRIRFYYIEDNIFEKASELSVDYSVRSQESLIIVETDRNTCLDESVVANTLALLAYFSSNQRCSIVFFPNYESLMLASLFTEHVYVLNNDGSIHNIKDMLQ